MLAETLTKYGSPVSSSVMVYHREEEFAAALALLLPSPVGVTEDDSVAGRVTDRRVDGLLPRTEVPKLVVKSPFDPPYAWFHVFRVGVSRW